jgi:hypothetical protein
VNGPWYHRSFFLLVAVQVIITIAERCVLLESTLTSAVPLSAASADSNTRQAVWFFGILVASALFIAYFGIDAVLSVNAFEVVTFFVTSLALIGRLAAEYTTAVEECATRSGGTLCLSFFLVSLLLCAANCTFCALMYKDLQWKKYKAIGAEVKGLAL